MHGLILQDIVDGKSQFFLAPIAISQTIILMTQGYNLGILCGHSVGSDNGQPIAEGMQNAQADVGGVAEHLRAYKPGR